MIIATLLVAVGLLVGAWAATSRGYRLSGVVVVSLLALYTLVDFAALPVFAASALLSYAAIGRIQDRWLLYGRPLLLAAVLVGALIPVGAIVVVELLVTGSIAVRHMDYVGTILPGIAAYNYYRAAPARRVPELAASAALFVGLLAIGVLSVLLWHYPPRIFHSLFGVTPADYTWPLLLTNGADVAAVLGLPTVVGPEIVGSIGAVTLVVLAGLVVGETLRDRWGLVAAGVIALPLVALFALRAWWVLPLYAGIFAVSYVAVEAIHRVTLLYGRALLSVAATLGVLLGFPAIVAFGFTDGVTVFFAGLLAGIGAFNLHSTAPSERPAPLVVTTGSFVAIFAVARALVDPLPTGLATTVGIVEVAAAALVLGAAIWILVGYEAARPAEATLREAAIPVEEVAR